MKVDFQYPSRFIKKQTFYSFIVNVRMELISSLNQVNIKFIFQVDENIVHRYNRYSYWLLYFSLIEYFHFQSEVYA